jgi:hypothetical protein
MRYSKGNVIERLAALSGRLDCSTQNNWLRICARELPTTWWKGQCALYRLQNEKLCRQRYYEVKMTQERGVRER